MMCKALAPIILNSSKGLIELKKGDFFVVDDYEDVKEYILKSYVAVIYKKQGSNQVISVSSWLDRLSADEHEIFEERTAILEYDADMSRERAEIEVIKLIIAERVIPGKCDLCSTVSGCMLTTSERKYCQVVKRGLR